LSFLNDIKKYYKAALLVNIILIIFIGYQLFYSKYYWQGEDEKIFTIEPGKNLDEIISGLKAADVISNREATFSKTE
jgi:cell division protein YceG involved in septum cleavage